MTTTLSIAATVLSTLSARAIETPPPALIPPFQQGGGMMQREEGSAQAIENAINAYMEAKENKSIVTPGDFTEYPLEMKAGQVLLSDAYSEAFDPALEVVDASGAVLEKNDDRYPGDQRPLLFWRCTADGKYALRVRSFQNKSGGQVFMRYRIFDVFDLATGQMAEREYTQSGRALLRIPMKKGQIKQIVFEQPDASYIRPGLSYAISPLGLPHVGLSRPLDLAIPDTLMAPVDGDYYVTADIRIGQKRKVRAATRDIVPKTLAGEGAKTGQAATNAPSLWKVSVKAGELLEISLPELSLHSSRFAMAEVPDITKFDLDKPENNPFFPPPPDRPRPAPAFSGLPSRARDPRLGVYYFHRDATIWLASNGGGEKDKQYTINVRPAARAFTDAGPIAGKLRIGNTDYWAFDAKVGDVMNFDFGAAGFAHKVVVKDPTMSDIFRADAMPDQANIDWNMIASRPGRYLVAISSIGDGGGGDYSLARKVFAPKEFAKGHPAQGDFADGQTEVWKFTAKPDEPLFVKWHSTDRSYDVSVRDETGAPAGLGLTTVDEKTDFGILKVSKPTTLLIVLSPREKKGKYSIELSDLPGYIKSR